MRVDDVLIIGKVTVQCMHYTVYVQIITVNLIGHPSVKKRTKRASTCDSKSKLNVANHKKTSLGCKRWLASFYCWFHTVADTNNYLVPWHLQLPNFYWANTGMFRYVQYSLVDGNSEQALYISKNSVWLLWFSITAFDLHFYNIW